MRSPRSALLLVPVLLAGAMPARAQQPPTCQAGAAHVKLSAARAAPAELCIQPGRVLTFLFDSPLVSQAVVLEGREHLRQSKAMEEMLVVMPSERLPPGARLELEVRFADGQVPQSARFTLVAHPEQAAHQVQVTREVTGAQPVVSDCPPGTPRPALFDMLESGKMDETGLTVHPYKAQDFSQSPGTGPSLHSLAFFRSRAALTLQVRLKNEDAAKPWTLEGATLLGPGGVRLQATAVHPATPLAPGASELRWVEWEMLPPGAMKRYTLQLWEADKARTATVPGLKLP